MVAIGGDLALGAGDQAIRHSADHHRGDSGELGGGGELVRFQHANAGIQAIHAALQDGQFFLEFGEELFQLIGGFGDPIEAGVEQGSGFKAGDGLAAGKGAVGIAGHAAIALDQVGERLVGPIRGLHISELADAGDLLVGSFAGACVAVDPSEVDIKLGRLSRQRREQAQGDRGRQQLLKTVQGESSHIQAPCAAGILAQLSS